MVPAVDDEVEGQLHCKRCDGGGELGADEVGKLGVSTDREAAALVGLW